MILDTCAIIDLMNGNKDIYIKIQQLQSKGTPLIITAPTLFELFSGLAQSKKPDVEVEKIHRMLHQQPRWPLDDASAEHAGRIFGTLVKNSHTIDEVDAMIAGIALSHQESILTRNAKHFSRVPGITVETY